MSINWFRYHDDVKDKDFYYNTETQETVWKYPTENAVVWDSVTREKVPPPKSDGSKHAYIKNINNDLFAKMIDDYATMDVNFEEFSSLFLKNPKDFEYSTQPLKDCLISTIKKKNDIKLALKMNAIVLKLTGSSSLIQSDLIELVHNAKKNPFLVDEIFVQLWKQLINTPPDSLTGALQTFLVMTTLFTPGAPLQKYLLNIIATHAQKNDYAKFVFIRLHAKCVNTNGEDPHVFNDDDTSILAIISHPSEYAFNFGVSLWEISYHQRKKYPKLPIPLVMHQMATYIKAQNGFSKVGIFRLPGNMKTVDTLIYKGNHGEEFLEGIDVETVASLFKRWLRDIPGKIISEEHVIRLMEVDNSDKAIHFAEELEFPSKMVLRYLIGFLRDVASSSDVNQMHAKNLAMVFGPNVVAGNDKVNPLEHQAKNQFFMESLIEKWDVSDIYPLPQYMSRLHRSTC